MVWKKAKDVSNNNSLSYEDDLNPIREEDDLNPIREKLRNQNYKDVKDIKLQSSNTWYNKAIIRLENTLQIWIKFPLNILKLIIQISILYWIAYYILPFWSLPTSEDSHLSQLFNIIHSTKAITITNIEFLILEGIMIAVIGILGFRLIDSKKK